MGNMESVQPVSRRSVLQATGGAISLGVLGSGTVSGQEDGDCEGMDLENPPDELPEIDLRADEPTAVNLPDAPEEVLIFCYGYDTGADRGRREAATLKTALEGNGYASPLVLAHWESQPEEDAQSQIEQAENFEEVEGNADRDGHTLASWLGNNYTNSTVHLAGHSTGARVVLRALTQIAGSSVGIDTVSLFGPAIASGSICTDDDEFDLSAAGSVDAYFSQNDATACGTQTDYFDLFAEERASPVVGCEGAQCGDTLPDHFTNRDVTDTIDTHCSYFHPDIGIVPRVVSDIGSTEDDAGDGDDGEDESPEAWVSFSDQSTEGDTLIVDSTELEEGGFVVIHDGSLDENGAIESTVGVSSYLVAGERHEDIEIVLDEPLDSGGTMTAMAHMETNDNDRYDFGDTDGEGDGPYVNADEQAITDSAHVTIDGEDATDDDGADDGTQGESGEGADDGTDEVDGEDETDGDDNENETEEDSEIETGEDNGERTDGGDGEEGAGGEDEASTDGEGAGFGILSTIIGLGSGGYVLSRRLADDEHSSEE